jgi:hypothetical protein
LNLNALDDNGRTAALTYQPSAFELQESVAPRSNRGAHRVVPGSGHLIVADRPDVVAAAILELVDDAQ